MIIKLDSPEATSLEIAPVATPIAPEPKPKSTSRMPETLPQMIGHRATMEYLGD